jgi:hypothetical protein
VQLYRDVALFPGASTQHHLFTQHGLRVNGPLYSNPAEGPACLLVATKASGQPAIVKMLSNAQGGQQPGGTEAAACRQVQWHCCAAARVLRISDKTCLPLPSARCFRALYWNVPEGTPLVAAEVVTLELTEDHKSTGRQPGPHAALVMPVYASTVARLLGLQPSVLLEQGKRIQGALEYVHSRGYVHLDVKV